PVESANCPQSSAGSRGVRLLTTRARALVANHATDMPPKPKQGATPNATPSAPPKQRSKRLSAWSPRGHQAVTSRSIMPTEQLTYAQIAERLSVSAEAARALVKRIACRARAAMKARPWPRSTSKRSGTSPCPRRHREVTGRLRTWSSYSKRGSPSLKPSLVGPKCARVVTRADFERERERADHMVTIQDRLIAELENLRSLLEAAQQTVRPVTPRTWREMTWHERWRWLHTTG